MRRARMECWGKKPKRWPRFATPKKQAIRMMIGHARILTCFACTMIPSLLLCSLRRHQQKPRRPKDSYSGLDGSDGGPPEAQLFVAGNDFAVLNPQIRNL